MSTYPKRFKTASIYHSRGHKKFLFKPLRVTNTLLSSQAHSFVFPGTALCLPRSPLSHSRTPLLSLSAHTLFVFPDLRSGIQAFYMDLRFREDDREKSEGDRKKSEDAQLSQNFSNTFFIPDTSFCHPAILLLATPQSSFWPPRTTFSELEQSFPHT